MWQWQTEDVESVKTHRSAAAGSTPSSREHMVPPRELRRYYQGSKYRNDEEEENIGTRSTVVVPIKVLQALFYNSRCTITAIDAENPSEYYYEEGNETSPYNIHRRNGSSSPRSYQHKIEVEPKIFLHWNDPYTSKEFVVLQDQSFRWKILTYSSLSLMAWTHFYMHIWNVKWTELSFRKGDFPTGLQCILHF